ncbi:MAG: DUF1549 domain-containing protein [Ignavibacteria bacterium]|nr:DUF1549 domain-containing protein [Ignavibacteria bacterium]
MIFPKLSNNNTSSSNTKLIISVYLLFIAFITLLLVMTSDAGTSRISSEDIDKLIKTKWDENNLKPSEKTSDAEFLRRVTLDLTGRIPSGEEAENFLNDKSKDKRSKKIDELLQSAEFGYFFADEWMKILFSNDAKRKVNAPTYNLVRNQFAGDINSGLPYSEFVKRLISANGFVSSNPYALYIGRFDTPEDAAGNVMKIFTGKQIQCAQCHKHPYENITQEDFYGVASFFSRKHELPLLKKDQAEKITKAILRLERKITKARDMEMENNTEGTNDMNEEMMNSEEHKNVKKNKNGQNKVKNEKKRGIPPQWVVDSLKNRMSDLSFKPDLLVWDAVNGQLTYEVKGEKKTAYPKFLGGASVQSDAGIDRRMVFAENITEQEKYQLAKAFVNRFWKHFFGYGFINPVDDITESDNGSNPQLLDKLANEFMLTNFDIKGLFRLITNTEVYQLKSTPNETNKEDHEYFSRAVLRPMDAIQLSNSLLSSSGYLTTGKMLNKSEEELDKIRFRILQLFVYTFQDDEMNEAEDFSGTITQALLMMNSSITEKITEKRPGNYIAQIMKKETDPQARINLLYLNTLGRFPSDKEMETALKIAGDKEEGYEDLLWAILNSSEFIFNH